MLGRPIQDGLQGLATVHSRSRAPEPTPQYIGGARINLVVQVGAEPSYKVALKCSAPGDKYPYPGQVVPVIVDRSDPRHVQIDWDRIQTAQEQFENL